MVPRPLPWFALVTMVLVTDSTSAGGGGTVLSTGAAVTSRAVANRTKASVGSGGSCATHVDCPAQQYCDDTFSCYQCSYLANRKANCDALAQDCCSAAFLRQCPGNPKGCADTCAAALEAACGADHHDVFACAQCSGIHQQQLQVAGCDNNAIAGWCASVGPGPAPAPVYNHYHCEGSQCKVGWARDHGANYTTDSCDGRCKGYACQCVIPALLPSWLLARTCSHPAWSSDVWSQVCAVHRGHSRGVRRRDLRSQLPHVSVQRRLMCPRRSPW